MDPNSQEPNPNYLSSSKNQPYTFQTPNIPNPLISTYQFFPQNFMYNQNTSNAQNMPYSFVASHMQNMAFSFPYANFQNNFTKLDIGSRTNNSNATKKNSLSDSQVRAISIPPTTKSSFLQLMRMRKM